MDWHYSRFPDAQHSEIPKLRCHVLYGDLTTISPTMISSKHCISRNTIEFHPSGRFTDTSITDQTNILHVHPVSITRFPLSRFSPGAGLLGNPFVHRRRLRFSRGWVRKDGNLVNGDRVYVTCVVFLCINFIISYFAAAGVVEGRLLIISAV